MHKKLTITVDEEVYESLHRVVGRQRISQFIETLVRPHVIREDLLAAIETWPGRRRGKPKLMRGPRQPSGTWRMRCSEVWWVSFEDAERPRDKAPDLDIFDDFGTPRGVRDLHPEPVPEPCQGRSAARSRQLPEMGIGSAAGGP